MAARNITTKLAFLLLLSFGVSLLGWTSTVHAEPNPNINYQGKLTDATGATVSDGTYNMRFWLLQNTSQATTSAVWTEERLVGSSEGVQVTNGLFSVMLGSTSPLTSVDFNQDLYLGVEIGGTGGSPSWDGEMSPRKPLGTVPAAFESYKLGGVASSSFVRSDQSDTIAATDTNTLLTINQSGTGDILNLLDGGTEVFTVTDNGYVGLGATSVRLLTVSSTTNAGGRFIDETNSVTVDVRSEDFQGFMGTVSAHDLRLITNNASRMTIASGGYVGIGTTSPTTLLTVGSSTISSIASGNRYNSAFISGDLEVDGTIYDATWNGAAIGDSYLTKTGDWTGTLDGYEAAAFLSGGFSTSSAYYFAQNALQLGQLSDVSTTSIATNDVLYWNGSSWVTTGTSSWNGDTMVVVAASDSPASQKAHADYVADGTDDEVEIQQALDSLSASGGMVHLLPGTFTLGTTSFSNRGINFATSSVALVGSGKSTVLQLRNSFNATYYMFYATGVTDITVRDMTLDLNKTGQTTGTQHGIHFAGTASSTITGLSIKDGRGSGIRLYTSTRGNQITNNMISGFSNYGIDADTVYHTIFANNTIHDNSWEGITFYLGGYNTVTGNIFRDMGNQGVLFYNGDYNLVTGNVFESSNRGIYFENGSSNNTVTGNTFQNNTTVGVFVENSSDNLVSGNNFINNNNGGATGTGVIVSSNSDRNLITGNRIVSAAGTGRAIDIQSSTANDNVIANNTHSGTGALSVRDLGTGTMFDQFDRRTLTTPTTRTHDLFSITGSTSATSTSITQLGTGDILTLDNATGRVFTVGNDGTLTVSGLTSGLLTADANGVLSTTTVASSSLAASNWVNGYVLQASSTAAGGFDWVSTTTLGFSAGASALEDLSDVAAMTENYGDLLYWNGSAWADIATSSLGLGNGTFLGLSDTPGSYTTNAIPYVSGSALAFDSTFVYDGTNLGLGTASPGAMLDIFGTSNALRLSYDGSNYSELSVNASGDLSISSTGGTGSTITFGTGLAEDLAALFDGSAVDFYLGLDDTDDTFKIGTGPTVGTNGLLTLTSATTTIENILYVSTTTATSTFANGIKLEGGCFQDASGSCIKSAGDTAVVVAAADSPANEKAYADYTADGTADEATIQAAIDYVAGNGGGEVRLLAGNYAVGTTTYATSVITLASSTSLIGQGSSTVLTLDANTANTVAMILATSSNHVRVAGLHLEGNLSNNTASDDQYGIWFSNTSSSSIAHVIANDFQNAGVYLSYANGNTVEQVTAGGNENLGIYLVSSSNNTVANSFINSDDAAGIGIGLLTSSNENVVQGNLVEDSVYGVYLDESSDNMVVGNQVNSNSSYNVLVNSNSNNNIITSNQMNSGSGHGLYLGTASVENHVSNNQVYGNGSYGIEIGLNASRNIISDNTVAGNPEGIVTGQGATDNSIIGNQIATNSVYGIRVSWSSDRTLVSGNVLIANGGGGNASIFLDDIGGVAPDDVLISGNSIRATGTAALIEIETVNSEHTVIVGNTYINPDTTTYVSDAGTDTRYNEWDRTTITTDDERAYNLFSITGSTSATSTSITQLGTGDILTLDNASGRVLTVDNSGFVGIGTSSPSAKLSVAGDTWLDSNVISFASSSASDLLLQYFTNATSTIKDSTAFAFTIATSSSASPIFRIDTDGTYPKIALTGDFEVANGAISYDSATNQTTIENLALGNMTFADDAGIVSWTDMGVTTASATGTVMSYSASLDGTPLLTVFGRADGQGGIGSTSVSIGSTTPSAKLTLESTDFDGAGVIGFDQYLQTTNSVEDAVQYGNRFYLTASNTATTTLVGSMIRVQDSTDYANTVRGLEVQAHRGINTYGENTALSGFARTFGVRGVTTGDAGATYEPAGGYFETEGTTQGNAIRGYSDTITTATLLSLFQSSSDFEGTGLEMNFGNGTGGSFSSSTSKYLDFRNANNPVFTVSAFGTTTIGRNDGSTANLAGLQIPFGGICVDYDGECTASTSGKISARDYDTGNSDLAETYFSSAALETGEVVTLAGELSIERANRDSVLPILGVVSTKPGITLGADDVSLTEGETRYPVALTGRVPVKLSTENGPIKKGDQLMLSSLPGIAMKATGTGATIGIALEDFDDERMYSETYINQFGDDMIDPVFEPIFTEYDPRIDDGCYFGGGSALGEDPCVPLNATTTEGRIEEANDIIERESVAEALQALRETESETIDLDRNTEVKVGQIVMFVDRGFRWVDDAQLAGIQALMGTSSIEVVGDNEDETIFDRLVALANRFVDGVLSVFTLKADRVEIANELCVDGVCVTADDLRLLLDVQAATTDTSSTNNTGSAGGSTNTDSNTSGGQTQGGNAGTEPDDTASSTDQTASSTNETVPDTTEEQDAATSSPETVEEPTTEPTIEEMPEEPPVEPIVEEESEESELPAEDPEPTPEPPAEEPASPVDSAPEPTT